MWVGIRPEVAGSSYRWRWVFSQHAGERGIEAERVRAVLNDVHLEEPIGLDVNRAGANNRSYALPRHQPDGKHANGRECRNDGRPSPGVAGGRSRRFRRDRAERDVRGSLGPTGQYVGHLFYPKYSGAVRVGVAITPPEHCRRRFSRLGRRAHCCARSRVHRHSVYGRNHVDVAGGAARSIYHVRAGGHLVVVGLRNDSFRQKQFRKPLIRIAGRRCLIQLGDFLCGKNAFCLENANQWAGSCLATSLLLRHPEF